MNRILASTRRHVSLRLISNRHSHRTLTSLIKYHQTLSLSQSSVSLMTISSRSLSSSAETDTGKMEQVEREAMNYDVVCVGAGPAGLSAAIRLKQQAIKAGVE